MCFKFQWFQLPRGETLSERFRYFQNLSGFLLSFYLCWRYWCFIIKDRIKLIRYKSFLARKRYFYLKQNSSGELTPRLLDCLRGEYFKSECSEGNNSELSSGISAELIWAGGTSSSSSPNWRELFSEEFQDLDVSFWQPTDWSLSGRILVTVSSAGDWCCNLYTKFDRISTSRKIYPPSRLWRS